MTAAPAEHAAPDAATFSLIQISALVPSKTNPRKTYGKDQMAELVQSVRARGILHPILVRPLDAKRFEVVCGERRFRAAQEAKLPQIPAMVRTLSDLDALELQLIENSQRSDVHPLEEADAFQQLQEKHGRTVEEIAAKIGKSTAHVYQRLKLCSLCKPAREALWSEKINAAIALLIARIPNQKLQEQATKEITETRYRDEAMTLSEAREFVRDNFMLVLAQAPFDCADKALVPAAGACSACPKRTGAQAALFPEVAKEDLCLDTACYEQKSQAAWKQAAAKAEEGGAKVLSEKETKEVFPYSSGSIGHASKYRALDEHVYEDSKHRTLKELIGAQAKGHVVLARDPDGKTRELISKARAAELIKERLPSVAKQAEKDGKDRAASKKQRDREKEDTARNKAATAAVMSAIVEKATAMGAAPGEKFWKALLPSAIREASYGWPADLLQRRGIEVKKATSYDCAPQVKKHALSLPKEKIPAFCLEALLTRDAYRTYSDQLAPELVEAAKALGVDVAKVKKAALDALKPAAAPAKPKAKKR